MARSRAAIKRGVKLNQNSARAKARKLATMYTDAKQSAEILKHLDYFDVDMQKLMNLYKVKGFKVANKELYKQLYKNPVYKGQKYTTEHMDAFVQAINAHVNPDLIAYRDLNKNQADAIIQIIRKKRKAKYGYDFDETKLHEFDELQLYSILFGVENNVDVNLFYNTEIDANAMGQLAVGAMHGVDVSDLAKPGLSYLDISLIILDRLGKLNYEEVKDMDEYWKRGITHILIYTIGLFDCGIDLTLFNEDQLLALSGLYEKNPKIDILSLAKPDLPAEMMLTYGTLRPSDYPDISVKLLDETFEEKTEAQAIYLLHMLEFSTLLENPNISEEEFNTIIMDKAKEYDLPNYTIKLNVNMPKEKLIIMKEGLDKGYNIDHFLSKPYTAAQSRFILTLLKENKYEKEIKYLDESFTDVMVNIMLLARYDGIDLKYLSFNGVTEDLMKLIYQDAVAGLDISSYAKPGITYSDALATSKKQRELRHIA